MKISEVTLSLVKQQARVELDNDDALIEKVYMPAALNHLMGYVGMTAEQLDEREDMALAYLALCAYMIDNRGVANDDDKISKVIDSIVNKYSANLV